MDSESDNDWSPQIEPKHSFFSKQEVEYSNQTIASKVEDMLSVPNYYNDDDLDPEHKPQNNEKTQALYDPLDDDENQKWMRQHFLPKNSLAQKPLVCPSCFRQLAYAYEQISQKQFLVRRPQNIEVLEAKVIRDRNAPEKMCEVSKENLEDYLIKREQEFNVKIICTCECGSDAGYYDVNKEAYILLNVI